MPIRVGFVPGDLAGWLGGVSYHRNLLTAVAADPESRLDPVLFAGRRLGGAVLDGLPSLPLIRARILDRPSPAWLARVIGRSVLGRDVMFERRLRDGHVAALSHTGRPWVAPGIAMLGWIPDFQHRRLPDLFSARERRQRDRTFRRSAAAARS